MYRTIDCDTWGDPWFEELDIEERVLFLYLITTSKQTSCGVFQISIRTLGYESGLGNKALATLRNLCASEPDAPRVVCWEDHNVIWVRNFYRYQRSKASNTFRISAANALAEFPQAVQDRVLEVYPELSLGTDSHPPPTPYPIDTLSIPSDTLALTEAVAEQSRTEALTETESTSQRVEVWVERARDQQEPLSPPPPPPLEAVPKIKATAPALVGRIEQAAGDLRGKSLTRSERKTVSGWFEKNRQGLTEEIVDEAERQTAEHTSDGSMAYFFRVMERMVQDPGGKKPGPGQSKAGGNANGQLGSGNGHRTGSEKHADNFFESIRRIKARQPGSDGDQGPGSERLPAPAP